ncbi:MAG: hypothetical protein M3P11_10275 [Actinomycetota bacterium]|nr:hypothetical protein [Actinomycetota bacterium]
MSTTAPQDDRILPLTRVVAAVVIVILLFAWGVLFLLPSQTDHRFAWTIRPSMTALLMGAGYGSALYFFARVLTGDRWHRVALGFLPTTVFTWMMLVATMKHWDRFHHGSLAFALWFWIYLITPVLVPAVWFMNRRHDPGVTKGMNMVFPSRFRLAMALAGGGMLAIAAWMYFAPASAADLWPWGLTALTARAVASFVALPGVAWLAIAADARLSAAPAMLGTLALGLVLLLVAVARSWNEFDHSNVLSFVYVAGLVATLVAIGGLSLWIRNRERTPQTAAPAR